MQLTAYQIKTLLDGTIEGNPNVIVDKLAKIEDAQVGSLSFLANPRYEHYLYTTHASAIIINNDYILTQPIKATLIRVKDPYSSFSILLEKYNNLKVDKKGIEESCFIHPTATIGENVYIGAFAYIGPHVSVGNNCKIYPQVYLGDGVKIGPDCTLYAGVKIYNDCILGERIMIHANTVIGSDGFGFAPQSNGSYKKIIQIGNVIIEDDVEIGSNTSIDRATLGSTIIHKGVKIDNLIQLAHNVEVGENTVIAAQTGVSGSSKIGKNSIIGGQVGIVGHVHIANHSQIQAKAGINHSIKKEGEKWSGIPATQYTNHMRAQVVFRRLPEIEKQINELQNTLNSLNQSKQTQ